MVPFLLDVAPAKGDSELLVIIAVVVIVIAVAVVIVATGVFVFVRGRRNRAAAAPSTPVGLPGNPIHRRGRALKLRIPEPSGTSVVKTYS